MAETLQKLQGKASEHVLRRVYVYDLVKQYTIHSDYSTATLLGYSTNEIDTLTSRGLECLIHPDDLDLVSAHFQRLTLLRSGDVITLEYRMRRADDTWCWLCSVETPLILGKNGLPLRILGIVWVMAPSSTPILNTAWQWN